MNGKEPDTYPAKPQGGVFPQETQEASATEAQTETTENERQFTLPFVCLNFCPACPRCRDS